MLRAFRVISPLAVNQETVVMLTWRKFDRSPPNAVFAFPHIKGPLLPVCEIARQLHSHRSGRLEGEGLSSPIAVAQFCIPYVGCISHILIFPWAPEALPSGLLFHFH